ncbi:Ascorbate peroxidase [Caligus rogercresseyi]|uniref:Ascorbate peroxidase n=1 Tax=Caligus rogercresseyi TaxID=217165 RepID=A0A7T8H3H2_CALRO|nr:Ascorbate peroxidase [Caligus rogercresseyi]
MFQLFNTRVVPVVEALETIFNYEDRHGFSIKKVMSRADFWALGSIEATKISIRLNNERCEASELEGCETKEMYLPFMYGRTDCSTRYLKILSKELGFDAKETTVIMGGHSVGFSANTTIGNVDGFSNQYSRTLSIRTAIGVKPRLLEVMGKSDGAGWGNVERLDWQQTSI